MNLNRNSAARSSTLDIKAGPTSLAVGLLRRHFVAADKGVTAIATLRVPLKVLPNISDIDQRPVVGLHLHPRPLSGLERSRNGGRVAGSGAGRGGNSAGFRSDHGVWDAEMVTHRTQLCKDKGQHVTSPSCELIVGIERLGDLIQVKHGGELGGIIARRVCVDIPGVVTRDVLVGVLKHVNPGGVPGVTIVTRPWVGKPNLVNHGGSIATRACVDARVPAKTDVVVGDLVIVGRLP